MQAFLSVAISLPAVNAHSDEVKELRFMPEKSTQAYVKISNRELTISSIFDGGEKISKVLIDTDTLIHIEVNDYNFDGYKDFSVYYLDGGMATHLIYRIFLYSKKNKNFVETQPKCGDQFVDIRTVKKSKRLVNSYYSQNLVKTCSARYLVE